jgi:DNA (cytosine-5)-methyltransferase 1
MRESRRLAIDLFAGAGGLSLGFENSGYSIAFAVDIDKSSMETYSRNRINFNNIVLADVSKIDFSKLLFKFGIKKNQIEIVLAGIPCQGFSISNRKTRNFQNPKNKLFWNFINIIKVISPKWFLLENVAGIVDFESGIVVNTLIRELTKVGYSCSSAILNSADFGVPQLRRRFFLVGNRLGLNYHFPVPLHGVFGKPFLSVEDAISDLPVLQNGNSIDCLKYKKCSALSSYQVEMRKNWKKNWVANNLVTKNNDLVIERYKHILPGNNWTNIPEHLMGNYQCRDNCHSGIYKRLELKKPSIVIGNFRKCMLVHPVEDRGLSVREAARIQSFPDNFIFYGCLGNQQQQVADAIPPILAKSIAQSINEKMR